MRSFRVAGQKLMGGSYDTMENIWRLGGTRVKVEVFGVHD